IGSWSGTDKDHLIADSNFLTMPDRDHEVTITYIQSCYLLVPKPEGSGRIPQVSPERSEGCDERHYHLGTRVTLTADPLPGYKVERWSDTDDDESTSTTNTVTMPGQGHVVTVFYVEESESEPIESPDLPLAPETVTASDGTYSDRIQIDWNASNGANSYEIWRSETGNLDDAQRIATSVNETSHIDTGIDVGKTYYYWVKAKNDVGLSELSGSDSGYSSHVGLLRISDLTAMQGELPGVIKLQWSVPESLSVKGQAVRYELRFASKPIESENDWNFAFDESDKKTLGLPEFGTPGSQQEVAFMTGPGARHYFAIRLYDEQGNASELSNTPVATAPGNLVREITEQLQTDLESILDKEVSIMVIAAHTSDWTFGSGNGDSEEALKVADVAVEIHDFFRNVKHALKGAAAAGKLTKVVAAKTVGIFALTTGIKIALADCAMSNLFATRQQLLLGTHSAEFGGDPTLLMWDPDIPLLKPGMPYHIKGVIKRFQPGLCKIGGVTIPDFYYIKVYHHSAVSQIMPEPGQLYYNIPETHSYDWWYNLSVLKGHTLEELVCTTGVVKERYQIRSGSYIRVNFLESEQPLAIKIPDEAIVPTLASLGMFCGTIEPSLNEARHPSFLDLPYYLDATTSRSSIELIQGRQSRIRYTELSPSSNVQITTGSPVDIHLYDSDGAHVGAIYDTEGNVTQIENSIPDVIYFYGEGDSKEAVSIANPTSGAYTITVKGTGEGTYSQTIRAVSPYAGETYSYTVSNQVTTLGQEDVTIFDEIPSAPTGLLLIDFGSSIELEWNNNPEDDIAGYYIYRWDNENQVTVLLNSTLQTENRYVDSSVEEGNIYYYTITAVDTNHNESGFDLIKASREFDYLPVITK
ncbi:MAG: hypothetical protein AAF702_46160, partial [Chloroflexota bacterium]